MRYLRDSCSVGVSQDGFILFLLTSNEFEHSLDDMQLRRWLNIIFMDFYVNVLIFNLMKSSACSKLHYICNKFIVQFLNWSTVPTKIV